MDRVVLARRLVGSAVGLSLAVGVFAGGGAPAAVQANLAQDALVDRYPVDRDGETERRCAVWDPIRRIWIHYVCAPRDEVEP